MDEVDGGTQPTKSNNEAFYNIEQPNTWGDLRMLIGLFGFYRQLLTYVIWISDPVGKSF